MICTPVYDNKGPSAVYHRPSFLRKILNFLRILFLNGETKMKMRLCCWVVAHVDEKSPGRDVRVEAGDHIQKARPDC